MFGHMEKLLTVVSFGEAVYVISRVGTVRSRRDPDFFGLLHEHLDVLRLKLERSEEGRGQRKGGHGGLLVFVRREQEIEGRGGVRDAMPSCSFEAVALSAKIANCPGVLIIITILVGIISKWFIFN